MGVTATANQLMGPVDRTIRRAQYVAVAGITFQVIHLVEHVAQTFYWFLNPSAAPWLTPWAVVGRDMLVVGGRVVTGNELLHLFGNALFFAALMAMAYVARSFGRDRSAFPHLPKAITTQGLHVAEHVLLTLSTFVVGRPLGVSTLFGFADGAWGSSYRVWFHFLINAVATYHAAMALAEMHQERLVVPGEALRPVVSAV
jgi:hypothetical protein